MTQLLESFHALFNSNNRTKFIFSLLAVFLWLGAIGMTMLSDSLVIYHGDYLITALLAFSALFAILSVPRQQVSKSSKPLVREQDGNHATNH